MRSSNTESSEGDGLDDEVGLGPDRGDPGRDGDEVDSGVDVGVRVADRDGGVVRVVAGSSLGGALALVLALGGVGGVVTGA